MSDVAFERVFVYGTLRREARGEVQDALTRGWSFESYGRVAAELFDFGPYPGAVSETGGTAWVRGEVYRVPSSPECFEVLDQHEGEEFERTLVTVSLDDGGQAQAWIYWYRGEARGRRVPSGDYLDLAAATARTRSAARPR